MGFAEKGDFQREHRAVKFGGFVEARLAVAEAGELGAEIDDRCVCAARRVLQLGQCFTVKSLGSG